ncbi:hypothetical protein OF83DRAFT_249969 [Amylostereum chailletii]|nr:hypothetical protein OF83DRAFT_249969 [Amylostereum chailletii]
MFDTNFFSVVRVVQAFTPLLMRSADARIVNMSSLSSLVPIPTMSMYASAKAALNIFGDTLRVELAPLGIQVTTILAGTVQNSRDHSDVSVIMAPDSPYLPVKDAFVGVVSKAADGRMPGQAFAQIVVSQILRKRPAAKVWAGSCSLLVWLLGLFVPTWLLDLICARMYGLHKLAGVRGSRKTV